MNIYEYGIVVDPDQSFGTLKILGTSDLPSIVGLTFTPVDGDGQSLTERASGIVRVNGPHRFPDYADEYDLSYCIGAMLYHLSRILDLYSAVTLLFEKVHPDGTAMEGSTSDPKIYFELDAFLLAARRVYEAIRKVLWKHYGSGKHRWRSISTTIGSELIPIEFADKLSLSWNDHGEALKSYRDCVAHYDPIMDMIPKCMTYRMMGRWGLAIKLPVNPGVKNRTAFEFSSGPEALMYCHSTASHLIALCESLCSEPTIHQHLDNPKL